MAEAKEGEERILSHPKSYYEVGNIEEIQKLYEEEKIVIFFNPWALNASLIRWITIEPSNPITRNLVFSATGIVIPDNIILPKAIFSHLEENVLQMLKKKATKLPPPARQAGTLRRRMRERNYTYIDINVSTEEYGNCRYSCSKKYNSMQISDEEVDEIRNLYQNDEVEAREYLEQLINENYHTGDPDVSDYDYEDNDPDDEEIQYNDTDFDAVLETLVEE